MKKVLLSKIRIDGGTQTRVGLNQDTVAEYAELLDNGDLPEADVFDDGEVFWMADGFHRYAAYETKGSKEMPVNIRKGTKRDAILFSAKSNDKHGLRRTVDDKRHAVKLILADEFWKEQSDRQIAEWTNTSPPFVGKVRSTVHVDSSRGNAANGSTVNVNSSNGEPAPTRTGKDGKKRKVKPKILCEQCQRTGKPIEKCKNCALARKKKKAPVTTGDASEEPLEPLKDKEGETVPEIARPAFEVAKAIEGICREIDDIIGRVEEIAKGPGGRLLRIDSLKQMLKDAKGNLWANRATNVCPYCKGTGKGKPRRDPKTHRQTDECEACKGECWTAKHIWQAAPKDDK